MQLKNTGFLVIWLLHCHSNCGIPCDATRIPQKFGVSKS